MGLGDRSAAVTAPIPVVRASPGPRPGTIAERFDPRRNSVGALRLGLAGMVLVSHGIKLDGGEDPVGRLTGGSVDLGTMGVDGFFALSGFLIAGSFLTSPSAGRYLWRRALRILPGFWVCLLLSAAVMLPLAQLLDFGTFAGFPLTGEDSALTYVTHNALLFITQYEVTGLLDGESVNGSLYTLFYEFVCYLGVLVLGVVGLLRRPWVVVAIAVALWVAALGDLLLTGGGLVYSSTMLAIAFRFGTMFVAGVVLKLLADRVPLNVVGAVVAAVALVAGTGGAIAVGGDQGTLVYLLFAPFAFAYLVLWLGSRPLLHRVGVRRDLSYGFYVYASPVQVLLWVGGATDWPLPLFLLVSLVLTLGMAWLSWTLVESPALAYKSWTPRRLRRPVADEVDDDAPTIVIQPVR